MVTNIVRKYRWTLPKDSPHTEKLRTRGVAFGMVMLNEKLKISFEKLY